MTTLFLVGDGISAPKPKDYPAEKAGVLSAQQREALAVSVADKCHTLSDIADEIRQLWAAFRHLEKPETILGCRTRTEYCFKFLKCSMRAVRYALENKEPKRHPKVKYVRDSYDEDGDMVVRKIVVNEKDRLLREALREIIVQRHTASSCGDAVPQELKLAIDEAEKTLRRLL
jgi:hypothetical protein